MESLELELNTALDALAHEKTGDCGCGGKKHGSPAATVAGDALAAELEAALDALEAEDTFAEGPGDDPFSDLAIAPGPGIDDLVALAERHPGLKIRISF